MFQFVVRRLLATIPTLLGVMVAVFIALHLIPGDPVVAMLGDMATPEQVVAVRHELGLDRPLPLQFVSFVERYLRGELGNSIRTRRPVAEEISDRFPHTFLLAAAGVFIAVLFGIPLGIVAATRRGSLLDLVSLVLSMTGIAAPVFWVGLLLSMLFAIRLHWLPAIGAGKPGDLFSMFEALVLPAFTLGFSTMALIARMTRSSMLEVLREDYVRTARAKGLSEKIVLYKHALRNAAIPIVTIVGLNIGYLLGGAVLVETVFARPGLGKLLVDAILARDYPVVQGVTFFVATSFVLVNLLTDLIYALLDPQVRLS
ncbi:MAG: ABC transporter permease [Firmicutes bacterium]|nr:ABC transporter permease [Bacillota bacterium]MCL5039623.1 ABC transporter permease [Bacillota bacterium]